MKIKTSIILTLILPLTLALSLRIRLIHEKLLSIPPNVKKIDAMILIIASACMLYTGLLR